MSESVETSATLWIWSSPEAPASWHFLTIDGEAAEAIRATALMRRLEGGQRRGWGSIRVKATIGDTRWQTSVFPSKESGGYLLPVKAAVRKAEGLIAGDEVLVQLAY
ncbi:MAG TPA: DUF1905 domain-containing protein [Sphingorhabdus sp.]|uniref:DUF1905 domain-containing protein n=1 Tax=Sphingorhabdus sp. TaxID=1902408 RepID=UPI002BA799DD|nr:DUF1905 domain-containing protein [Sphingorhabdus sp.]HMT42701.1 DUF1905 domain-containing protein [Sphingorhabdus sp.]HMU23056.1 DUF1905 domain-containing protein [Sphingorhabdus sp.]